MLLQRVLEIFDSLHGTTTGEHELYDVYVFSENVKFYYYYAFAVKICAEKM